MRRQRAASAGIGGHGDDALDVGQHFGGAADFGQDDDAIDPQHAGQPWVLGVVETRQAGLDMLQGLVVVAELHQLMREVAMQHRVVAMAACRRRIAQRLVHVGEGLLGFVARRIAARDRVQQQAALIVAQHGQAFVAQRQHKLQRFVVAALAPQAARQAGLRQDAARPIAQALEDLLRSTQLGRGNPRPREVDQMEAPCQPRPALAGGITTRQRLGQRLVGQFDRARRVDVEQLPGLLRQAACFTGAGGGGRTHAGIVSVEGGLLDCVASTRWRMK